ncbi:MAG: NAD-dependent epimerase/dehydratase family protein [Bacteroidales bacterium]|nr:NAD-dependent epimerase/dehydratase family protein [Bacteroidales bacterium]MCF8456389.1 NAD-dependent epimerase/dehydratase family protein [Bacteroidales bacterium]
MEIDSKIFVAGHKGLVGSAILRALLDMGYENVVFKNRGSLDLTDQIAVNNFFRKEKIDYVFLSAAKVGGILANNTFRAQFLYENLQIQNNIIHSSFVHGVKKLLFLGSSCIYPKNAPQPLKEEYLLGSELEYTNEPYAIAKIAGIKMCESYNLQYGTNFISAMPTNLFGINDNFDLENSHVLPALLRKTLLGKWLMEENYDMIVKDFMVHPQSNFPDKISETDIKRILSTYGINQPEEEAEITLWGTGAPMREFLFADDLADACLFLMDQVDFPLLAKLSEQNSDNSKNEIRNTHINVGTGKDIKIADLATLIADIVGFTGNLKWDNTKPDGTPRKQLDVSKLSSLGWKPQTTLKEGIAKVYQHYLESL